MRPVAYAWWILLWHLSAMPYMLRGQDDFARAHDAVSRFYSDATRTGLNANEKQNLRQRGPDLSDFVDGWLTNGMLSYLNGTPRPSPEELKVKLAKALTPPTLGTGIVENSADVVSVGNGHHFYVVYDVNYCASCSNSWLGEFSRRNGKFYLQSVVKNPLINTTVHLAWLSNSSYSMLVLYGLHWGDAHNHVDVKAFSTDGRFRELWLRMDLAQGQVSTNKNEITIAFLSTSTPEGAQIKEMYSLKGNELRMAHRSITPNMRARMSSYSQKILRVLALLANSSFSYLLLFLPSLDNSVSII